MRVTKGTLAQSRPARDYECKSSFTRESRMAAAKLKRSKEDRMEEFFDVIDTQNPAF